MAGTSRTGVGVAGAGIGLALGAAFGVFLLSPNIPGGTEALGSGDTVAASEHESLAQQQQRAERMADAADQVVAASGQEIINGVLDEQPVLMLATADADDDEVEKLRASLDRAGAIDSGLIQLAEKFFAQDGADELKTIVSNTLPAGTELSESERDPGTHAGQALGAALTFAEGTDTPNSTTEDRGLLLETLAEAGYLDYETGTILPGQAIVLVTGDGTSGSAGEFAAKSQAAFAKALDEAGGATVVAGHGVAAESKGVLAQLRDDEDAAAAVSTVDAIDQTWGRLATVLAVVEQLEQGSGAYGYADNADAVMPENTGQDAGTDTDTDVDSANAGSEDAEAEQAEAGRSDNE